MGETAAQVRVRFPPSPTGLFHVGNARTALFNWLYARHTGGTFILRIEDTDRERCTAEALANILEGLRWLGLDWDEGPEVGGPYGPYVQSERAETYRDHARRLVEQGAGYHCYCTPERLEQMRAEQRLRKQPPGYDRRCRDLTPQQRAEREAEGTPRVVRFAIPLEEKTAFEDLIRGRIEFENARLDDMIILKSDGFPTYHLASVVDDHLMRVSHVLRGEDWISSTPRHLLLYAALGWEPPRFGHLPMVLGRDRGKLSKRHGATAVTDYRDQGYLPEALANFLALQGWAPGDDTEIMDRETLIGRFSLEAIGKAPAIFDLEKLDWINGYFIRASSLERIADLALPHLQRAGLVSAEPSAEEREYVRRVLALEQERMKRLSEAPDLMVFFFAEEVAFDPAAERKWLARDYVADVCERLAARLEGVEPFGREAAEAAVRSLAEEMGRKAPELIHPVRVALSGRTAGPGLFEMMETLGRERVVKRLRVAAGRSRQLQSG